MKRVPTKNAVVYLYTDGACSGNPGPGGWAYILQHPGSGKEKTASGAEWETTNNRMELMAVIEGLRALNRPCAVEVISDSQYVLNGLKSWMDSWKQKGWRLSNKQPVKNMDLWMILDELKEKHSLTFTYIRGHSGHPENERCDQMAVAAYRELQKNK
ncbi:MAG: ribonuclease HI [Planctomycetia bacterium]|nr:ribonuclease HI [Planctomycetia bacterium]